MAVVVAVLALAGQMVGAPRAVAVPGPVGQPSAATVTADALPTAQIDGVVWSQVMAGNTVFAGGQFTSVRPAGAAAGTNQSARSNLMSYDIRTGIANPTFAPVFNGSVLVLALSPDQSTLYVGGQFTQVNDVQRNRFAALSVATGALLSVPAPNLSSTVYAIAVAGSTIYLGGNFNQVDQISRTRLAAINSVTGALTAWAPAADSTVRALVATPDRSRVIAAGNFATLNATSAPGMGSLDADSGAVRPWHANAVIANSGDQAAILTLRADADTIYGGGYAYGGGNFEGVFAADPTTGDLKWLQDCHGDTYDVAPVGDMVYSVGHAHFCSNIGGFPDTFPRVYHRALAVTKQATGTVTTNSQPGLHYGNFGGQPAPSLINWFPDLAAGSYTGKTQAAWSMVANTSYVALGGEFPEVNDQAQQGLVRFAVPAIAPDRQGPQVSGADFAVTPVVTPGRSVSLSWPGNFDRDDQLLTYDVLRDGVVMSSFDSTSQFWHHPRLSYVDRNVSPGGSYSYQVRVRDPHGNLVTSPSVSTQVSSDSSYADLVISDGAAHQWRLGSPPGAGSDPDTVGALPLTVSSGVAFGAAGALPADADTAATFDGGSSAIATTATGAQVAGSITIEAWVKTTSTTGGGLVGFGAADRSAASAAGDRTLYLDATGRVTYAERASGALLSVRSPGAVNDGAWHQLVAVHADAALQLYVDGHQVGAASTSVVPPAASGQWTLGGQTPSDLPGTPVGSYGGVLDDVSVTDAALSARQVYDHRQAGRPRFSVTGVGSGRR